MKNIHISWYGFSHHRQVEILQKREMRKEEGNRKYPLAISLQKCFAIENRANC
jgi:hypothetical protein